MVYRVFRTRVGWASVDLGISAPKLIANMSIRSENKVSAYFYPHNGGVSLKFQTLIGFCCSETLAIWVLDLETRNP